MLDRLYDYSHKLRILRQIQSNKAWLFRVVNNVNNIATVLVASFLTYMGFSGLDKIHEYVNWFFCVQKNRVEFSFNILVFLLFVLVILHLVFRFQERQAASEKALVSLTSLVNEIDDLLARSDRGYDVSVADVTLVRQKYEMLTQNIPPNTDSEFLRAKGDYQKKRIKAATFQLTPHEIFDPQKQVNALLSLVKNSPVAMDILRALRQVDERLFLAGSLARNIVWDHLHGHKSPTPIDDVDVVYFDPLRTTKEQDEDVEQKLKKLIPNLHWSVKNQNRMHVSNNDQPYTSLADALMKFPDTPSAFALQLNEQGEIVLSAPIGLDDLFRLIVRPTDHAKSDLTNYKKRMGAKKWQQRWARLKILEA